MRCGTDSRRRARSRCGPTARWSTPSARTRGTVRRSSSLLLAGLAALTSVFAVFATVPGWNPLQIALVVVAMLATFVGLAGLVKGHAWGALLIALWATIGVAWVTIYLSGVTGIDGIRVPFAIAALIEIVAAIVMAAAPRAKAG